MDTNRLLPFLLVGVLLDRENEVLQVGWRVAAQLETGNLHHHEDLLDVELREPLRALLQEIDEKRRGGEIERVEVGDEDEEIDGRLRVLEMLVLLQ